MGIIDFWEGLPTIEDMPRLVSKDYIGYEEEDISRLLTDLLPWLQLSWKKAFSVCPYATDEKHLREAPRIILMPNPRYSCIILGAWLYKLDRGGATMLACPKKYQQFWSLWLKAHDAFECTPCND